MVRRRPGQSRSAARRDAGLFKQIEEWLRVRTRQHRCKHLFKGDDNYYPPARQPPRSLRVPSPVSRPESAGCARPPQPGRHRDDHRAWKARCLPCQVDVQAPDGQWIPKSKQATFFPDDMTPQEVDEAISQAFRGRELQPNDSTAWDGRAGNGMLIGGFTDEPGGNRWKTVFPIMESE